MQRDGSEPRPEAFQLLFQTFTSAFERLSSHQPAVTLDPAVRDRRARGQYGGAQR